MSLPKRLRSRGTITFILLCVMAFILYIDRANISVAAPILRKELGFSNEQLGLIFSAFAIAYSCLMIPGGWHTDRIGARKGLLLYGSVWAVATMVTGAVGSLIGLVLARFAVGVGEAPIYPTAARLISRTISEKRRGAALGAVHGTGRIANALAPLIVTGLILAFSWRLAFIVLGAVTLAYMVAMYFGLGSRTPAGSETRDATAVPARPSINWPDLLRRVWPAAAACFCHGWVLWFFNNWVPSYFSQHYGLKIEDNAIFSTLVLLGGSLGTLAGGAITDWRFNRHGNRLRARRETIIFGFLVAILGLIPLMFTHSVVISAASLGFAFFFSEFADSEVVPEHAATSSACTFTGMAIAGAVSPIAIGALLDVSNNNWTLAFVASIVVLLLGPVFTMRIRIDDKLAAQRSPVRG
jgi:MFS family permease